MIRLIRINDVFSWSFQGLIYRGPFCLEFVDRNFVLLLPFVVPLDVIPVESFFFFIIWQRFIPKVFAVQPVLATIAVVFSSPVLLHILSIFFILLAYPSTFAVFHLIFHSCAVSLFSHDHRRLDGEDWSSLFIFSTILHQLFFPFLASIIRSISQVIFRMLPFPSFYFSFLEGFCELPLFLVLSYIFKVLLVVFPWQRSFQSSPDPSFSQVLQFLPSPFFVVN